MSRPHLPSYVRSILSFLDRIGAVVTALRHGRRIHITWRFRGDHHDLDLARHVPDPAAYVARNIASIRALTGLAGATA